MEEHKLHNQILDKTEEKIEEILEQEINPTNLDHLYKLTKIKCMVEEDDKMYGNYGRRAGYDTYGRESYGRDSYGRRGYDMKYRGDDSLDRMSGEYGRYQESRQRYGAGSQESDKSFHYMVKALEDFVMVLKEEAETPQQKQQLMEALQNSMR